MTSMTNSDLIEFGSYRKPFELGKELEHEEEDKCHESY